MCVSVGVHVVVVVCVSFYVTLWIVLTDVYVYCRCTIFHKYDLCNNRDSAMAMLFISMFFLAIGDIFSEKVPVHVVSTQLPHHTLSPHV